MDVKINQVILHILDAGASEPVLSDRPMELDADLYEYFSVCIEKAFASDDSKNCRFLPDSPFLQEMQHNDDFIDLSRRIAGVIFEQLLQYQGIPSGDLAVVDCAADGVPFYAVLKLNYPPRLYPCNQRDGQRPVQHHCAAAHPAAWQQQGGRSRADRPRQPDHSPD